MRNTGQQSSHRMSGDGRTEVSGQKGATKCRQSFTEWFSLSLRAGVGRLLVSTCARRQLLTLSETLCALGAALGTIDCLPCCGTPPRRPAARAIALGICGSHYLLLAMTAHCRSDRTPRRLSAGATRTAPDQVFVPWRRAASAVQLTLRTRMRTVLTRQHFQMRLPCRPGTGLIKNSRPETTPSQAMRKNVHSSSWPRSILPIPREPVLPCRVMTGKHPDHASENLIVLPTAELLNSANANWSVVGQFENLPIDYAD